jgi:hypothetical protein
MYVIGVISTLLMYVVQHILYRYFPHNNISMILNFRIHMNRNDGLTEIMDILTAHRFHPMGETRLVSDGEGITDLKDIYAADGDEIGGTLVIKAITNATEETSLRGDVNLDGFVNINDVTLIQEHIAAITLNLSEDQLMNADFNGDGVININDATAVQKHIATAANH